MLSSSLKLNELLIQDAYGVIIDIDSNLKIQALRNHKLKLKTQDSIILVIQFKPKMHTSFSYVKINVEYN